VRNRIESMLGGCAIREVYEQTDGLVGESFSVYDSSRRVWHQSWVTNRGQLLTLEGGMSAGKMILTGNQITDWRQNADGAFRHHLPACEVGATHSRSR